MRLSQLIRAQVGVVQGGLGHGLVAPSQGKLAQVGDPNFNWQQDLGVCSEPSGESADFEQ